MHRAVLPAALLAALLLAVPALAAPVRTPHVEAELVAERTAVAPGEPLTVALRLKMIPEWHTYWRNPGDSGEPTRLEWRLPPGFEASEIHWPYPSRLPAGPLMNYGYEGEVLLLVRITPPRELAPGTPVTLAAKAHWLVCSREHCIPEDGEVSLTLPVAAGATENAQWAKPIAVARAALPAPPAGLAGWTLTARGEPGGVTLTLVPPADAALRELVFFPFEQGKVEPAAPQPFARADDTTYRLKLAAAMQPVGEFARLAGVLVSPDGFGHATGARAVTIDVPIAGTVTPSVAPRPARRPWASGSCSRSSSRSRAAWSSTSCRACSRCCRSRCSALPAHGRPTPARAGTASSTPPACVAVVLAARRGCCSRCARSASELGWGFQLQSPAVVAALAVLFFVLALNLSACSSSARCCRVGARPGARANRSSTAFAHRRARRRRRVAVHGAVHGRRARLRASTQPARRALAVFTALGLGMALPYVAARVVPGLAAAAAAPGRVDGAAASRRWRSRCYAHRGLARLGARPAGGARRGRRGCCGARAWPSRRGRGARRAAVARGPSRRAGGAALVARSRSRCLPTRPAARRSAPRPRPGWQPFSAARVASLAAAGKPVFVDFTAAWCVTCQVNKRLVLGRDDVLAALRARKVVLVRADWTRRDAEITRALAALGRSGVPVYVLYQPGRAPVLLPEVLTRERVLAALDE